MTFAKYKENSKPLFLSLKILNIYELNIYLMALFMYSYFNENLPSYFKHRHAKRARVIFLVIGVFVELFTVMIWLCFFWVAMYSKKETGNL